MKTGSVLIVYVFISALNNGKFCVQEQFYHRLYIDVLLMKLILRPTIGLAEFCWTFISTENEKWDVYMAWVSKLPKFTRCSRTIDDYVYF